MIWQVILMVAVACINTNLGTEHDVKFVHQPQDKVAVIGGSLVWDCVIEPSQDAVYRWTFKGLNITTSSQQHTLYPNGTLHIFNITTNHYGGYSCIANIGNISIKSHSARLAPPEIAKSFSSSPLDDVVQFGEDASFSCEIISVPPADITWLHNGFPALKSHLTLSANHSRLYISNVNYEDEGNYSCVAVNPVSHKRTRSGQAVLTVQGPPLFTEEPQAITAPLNTSVLINCGVRGEPQPNITWTTLDEIANIVNIELTGPKYQQHSNGSLRINNLTESDSAFYTCTASNHFDVISKSVFVTVTENIGAPHFTVTPANTSLFIGEVGTWLCEAEGSPEPTITWSISHNISSDKVSYPYPGSIKVHNIQESDSGWYNCVAANSVGTVVYEFYINVYVPPLLQTIPSPVLEVPLLSNVYLPCVASGNPEPDISWITPTGYFESGWSLHNATVFSNGSLVVHRITAQDSGAYTCIASNIASTVTATTILHVTYEPNIVTPPQNTTTNTGSQLLLHCETTGYPRPVTLWYHNNSNTPVVTGEVYSTQINGSLLIRNIQTRHRGLYTCRVLNEIGTDNASALLTVHAPPQFTEPGEHMAVEKGISVLLDCTVTGEPQPSTKWVKDGETLVLDANMMIYSNHSLWINSLQDWQYGSYDCIASNNMGEGTKSYTVSKLGSPVFLTRPLNITANVTGYANIPCRAVANGPVTYQWYVGNQNKGARRDIARYVDDSNDRVYYMEDGTLVLEDIQWSDGGWYTCEASNSIGTVSASMYVFTQGIPMLTTAKEAITVQMAEDVLLPCFIEATPPSVEITWTLPRSGGSVFGNTSMYKINSEGLWLRETSIALHWGTWTCEACNIVGCSSVNVTLHIEGTPAIIQTQGFQGSDGKVIECTAVGTPAPIITYAWGNLKIRSRSPPQGHDIIANGSLVVDNGLHGDPAYSCKATNDYGTATKTFGVPGKVFAIHVSKIIPTSLTLSWNYNAALTPFTFLVEINQTLPQVRGSTRDKAVSRITEFPVSMNGTYNLNGLDPHTDYSMRVKVVNILGSGEFTKPVFAMTHAIAPSAVDYFDITFLVNSTILITWDEPRNLYTKADEIIYYCHVTFINMITPSRDYAVKYGEGTQVLATDIGYGAMMDIQIVVVDKVTLMTSDIITRRVVYNDTAPSQKLKITNILSEVNSLRVIWEIPDATMVRGYLLSYKSIHMTAPHVLTLTHLPSAEYLLSPLEFSTLYEITMAYFNLNGTSDYCNVLLASTESDMVMVVPEVSRLYLNNTIVAAVGGAFAAVLVFFLTAVFVYLVLRANKVEQQKRASVVYANSLVDSFVNPAMEIIYDDLKCTNIDDVMETSSSVNSSSPSTKNDDTNTLEKARRNLQYLDGQTDTDNSIGGSPMNSYRAAMETGKRNLSELASVHKTPRSARLSSSSSYSDTSSHQDDSQNGVRQAEYDMKELEMATARVTVPDYSVLYGQNLHKINIDL